MGYREVLPAAVIIAVSLAGCNSTADRSGGEAAEEASPTEAAPDYESLQAGDIEMDLVITEQNYFAVWNAAWIVQPRVDDDIVLEPESEWLVTYETTVPDAARFTGEKYSFTVEVDADSRPSYSGDGLEVERHAINAHPERLVLEVSAVIER